ncbi:phospholipid scramblase 1-like [Dysidea avara]|uniref:phospholipid scramblase 1-like n=1 Tax=Dysidea avara TaxID=196820 RepID=UPI00332A471B
MKFTCIGYSHLNWGTITTPKVMSNDGSQQVDKISKQWSGLVKEYFTDDDNFGIQFPMDLDVKMKAVMMGACFLIDFMFFERQQNN